MTYKPTSHFIAISMIASLLMSCAIKINTMDSLATRLPGSESENITASVSYAVPAPGYLVHGTTSTIVPSMTGSLTNFSISPALPPGLNLNPSTGTISGTPTTFFVPTTFTISANSSTGTVTYSLTLESAAQFTVNTTNDAADQTSGDGICASAAAQCTLRAAVQESAALPPAQLTIINVPAGTYTLTSTLNISSRLNLIGAGPSSTIIDGGNAISRVVNISGSVDVSMDSFSIQHGLATTGVSILGVGLSATNRNLTLSNCDISNNAINSTTSFTSYGSGMDIQPTGSFTMSHCTILGNSITVNKSFTIAYAAGANIRTTGSPGTIALSNNTFQSNTINLAAVGSTGYAGGLMVSSSNSSAQVHLETTTFTSNSITATSSARGGAAVLSVAMTVDGLTCQNNSISATSRMGTCVYSQTADGTPISINQASISDNSATYSLYFENASPTLSNSTVIGLGPLLTLVDCQTSSITNSTLVGGDVLVVPLATMNTCNMTIRQSTLQVSSAAKKVMSGWTGTVNIGNSIISNPSGDACTAVGNLNSLGYNIATDATCTFLTGTGDLQSTNPLLTALASNGGPTQTMAISSISPARDAIPLTYCYGATDQRGNARPNGSACDIGAYEY